MTNCQSDPRGESSVPRSVEVLARGPRLDCVSVVVLCKDNPDQLNATLASVLDGAQGLTEMLEVVVVDGSRTAACADLSAQWMGFSSKFRWHLRHHQQRSQGIYAALNEGIVEANGELLACMNSGDAYCSGGLTALVNHWKHVCAQGCLVPAVFGQARVEAAHGLAWLTPAPSMRNLSRWLQWMVPCHQALLFHMTFARQHPYPLNSLVADRVVMRAALVPLHSNVYLPQPVCCFRLDGVSSRWPTWRVLMQHLQDPHRRRIDRLAEVLKWSLRPVAGLQPWLMQAKALIWGLCCSR